MAWRSPAIRWHDRPTAMQRAVQVLLFYLLLLWLGAMLLVCNALAIGTIVLPPPRRRAFMQRFISAVFRLFLSGCCACRLMRLDLTALDAINEQSGPLLLVPNHPSMIDVFLVISRVRQAACLMKASVGVNVFLAVGARLAGYVSNRHDNQMVRQAVDVLRGGGRLLMFAEGSRTVDWPLNPLKSGAGLIAKVSGTPMQLIVLQTNSHYLAKGWPIWRAPAFPLVYRARLGPLLPVQASARACVTALEQALRRELSATPPLDAHQD